MIDQPKLTATESNVRSNKLYRRVAPIYATWVRAGSLWAFPALYRRAAEALELSKGDTVLDVCCGTGEMFSFLHNTVGPTGRIIGCDLSPEMLDVARARVTEQGWTNIALVETDAARLDLLSHVDGIICSICLSAIPERERVLQRVLGYLKDGGRLVVVDSLTIPGHPFANLYNRIKGRVIGADPDCGLKSLVFASLEDVDESTFRSGVYTLMAGRQPNRD